MSKTRGQALLVVYATVFLDLLGFGLIIPFLPYYAGELGASGSTLGLIMSSYSLAQLVGATLLGRLSDRWGRRPVILLSLFGSSLGMALSGLAGSVVALCVARAVAGLFGGSISAAQAYVADVTTPQERPRYMGMIGASVGMGFVLGPLLGVSLLAFGYGFSGAAFVAAGLALMNLVAAAVRLQEPGERSGLPLRPGFGQLWSALGRSGLRRPLLATFLVTLAFVAMETTFAYLLRDRWGVGEKGFGLALVLAGVVVIVIQGGLIGRLTSRLGVRPVAILGGAAMGLGLLAIAAAPTLPLVLAALALLAAGQGMALPSLSTLTSLAGGRDEQGGVLGLGQSLAAGARAVGPILAGALYDYGSSWPYGSAAASALLAAFLIFGMRLPRASQA